MPACNRYRASSSSSSSSSILLPEQGTQLYGSSCFSGGSDPSSAYLAALVHRFMEDEMEAVCGTCLCGDVDEYASHDMKDVDDDDDKEATSENRAEALQDLVSCTAMELLVLEDVTMAMKKIESAFLHLSATASLVHRRVTCELRCLGYNAAICRSKWSQSKGLPSGSYEYIDLIMEEVKDGLRSKRLVIDIDFRAEFEIARATPHYMAHLNTLPHVFVGTPERLQQVIGVMSEAAKASMEGKGLHVPPWRKLRYMQAKWFSAYTRLNSNDLRPQLIDAHLDLHETLHKAPITATRGEKRGHIVSAISHAFKISRLPVVPQEMLLQGCVRNNLLRQV